MKKMKKMLTLLMIFSLTAITHPLSAILTDSFGYQPMPIFNPSKHTNNTGYDIKEAARKFREKHANDPVHIHNDVKSKNGDIVASGHTYITSRKNTIDLIEYFGSFTHEDLIIAIKENDLPLVKFLLQHGANPNKTTELASPIVDKAIIKEFVFTNFYPIEFVSSVKMAQYLEDNGADLGPLFSNPDSLKIKNNPELHEYLENKKIEHNSSN